MLLLLFIMSFSLQAQEAQATQRTFLLEAGTKKIDLGIITSDSHPNSALNYSFVLERNKNSIKKVTLLYKMKIIRKKCTDYDVKVVMRPSFSQKVCLAVGNGDYQCEDKKYDQLYEAQTVCIEKGWVQEEVSKKVKISFKKAAALSEGSVEKFVISLKQKKYSSHKVEVLGDVVSSPVRYKISGGIFSDSLSFKVLH